MKCSDATISQHWHQESKESCFFSGIKIRIGISIKGFSRKQYRNRNQEKVWSCPITNENKFSVKQLHLIFKV